MNWKQGAIGAIAEEQSFEGVRNEALKMQRMSTSKNDAAQASRSIFSPRSR